MLDLIRAAEKISKLKASVLLRKVLKRADVQNYIINLNTEDQLKTDNINALGVKLYQIGGEYSVETLIIKGITNPKRITLYDTGETYESWAVIPLSNGDYEITWDSSIHGDDLTERWGNNIEGLTSENMVKANKFIQEKVIEEIESLL